MTETKTQRHKTYKAPYHNFTNPTLLSREELHRTFAGLLYTSDFDTEISELHNSESKVAGRILSTWRFDMSCQRNSDARERRIV